MDFRNFDYPTTPCNPKTAAVRAGRFTYNSDEQKFSIFISVDAIAAGDMRGDGSRQAAVTLTCTFPVGFGSQVLLFDVRGSKAPFLAVVAAINDAEFTARYRFANGFLYVDQCLGDNAPSTSVVTTYRLRGNRLEKVNVLKHTSPKDLGCPYIVR